MDKLLKQFGVRRQEDKTRSSCNLCKSCDNLFDVSRKDVGRYPLRPELTSHLPVRVVRDDLARKNSEERVPPLAKAKRVIGALTSAGKNLTNIQMVESHLVDLCERAKMFGNVNEDNDLYKSNSFRFQKVRERIPVKPKPEVAVEENYSFPLDLVVKRRPVAPDRTISIHRDRKVRVAEAYEDPSDSKYYCEPGEDRLAKIYGDTHYTQPYLDAPRSHKTGRLKDANENAYEDISTSYDYDSKDRLVTRIRINRPTQEEQETLIDLVYEDEYIDDRLSDLIENGTLRSEFDNELYFSPTEVIPEYSKVDAQHLLKKRTKKYKRYSVACDENFETDGTLRRSAFSQVHTLTIPVGDEYSTLTKDKALSSCPTLIDEPYYELVVVGGDSLPVLDDICRTLSAENGTDYYLSESMRRKQLYETAFDSRIRTDGQINTPDMENRNSILRRFWKGKNRSKLSPSDSKTSENIENDNFKIPRSRRIDNFTDEKNSETSVTKNDIDTSSIISLPVTPPSSVPLVPKFKRPASLTDSKISVSSITRQIDNLRVDNCTCPPNKNVPKNRYASSDSMASTGSTMSSLESLRSSTSESARSTSSSLSSHSSDDQSKKRQSLSLDLASRLQPRPKPALTLNPKKFQQMLSPISDKSQDVSSENRGSTSTTSPDDSERAKPEEPNPLETGPPKKPSRKSLSLQLSAGNYPYVSVQSDHASDSGISLGPTKDEGGCEDIPFPMPKLRKRTQIKTVLSGGPSSAKSSPVEELPFPMPKLRRRPNSMISTREACPPQARPQISPENEPMLFPMPKLRRKPNIGSDVRGENKNNLVLNFHNPIGGEKLTNLKLETKSNRSSLSLDIGSVPRNNAMNRSSLTLDFSSSMNILGEPVNPTIPLDKQTWFHGAITRVEAENILRSKPSGSYLVRNSESSRNEYSLSLKSARGFMHMRIQRTSVTQNIGPCDITVEHFVLGQFSKPFQTIPEMIRHYSVNKLPIKGAEHMCLLYPVIDQCL